MRKFGFILCLIGTLLLAACSNEGPAEQATEDQQSNTNDSTENTISTTEDQNDTTATIPPAALLIENATKLAEKQAAISGVVSFRQTDANGEVENYNTKYEISDIKETFEDGAIWPEFYRSYIQQELPDGSNFETYFSFGKSYFTYREGEWFGNLMDETFDMGMHYRINYFSPYAWLNYLGPFLESIAPFEAEGTDYVVAADINEPRLQEFFETNMYMLTEENSIYHYNDWTFVDEPIHIYFIFEKESNRLKEVGTMVKLMNADYGEYTFEYTQQIEALENGSIKLPTEVIEATGVSVW